VDWLWDRLKWFCQQSMQTSWLGRQSSWFVVSLQVPGWDLGLRILTESFCGFPLFFQANTSIVPHIGQDYFLPYPLQYIVMHSFYKEPQEASNPLVTEERYWALFYMPLVTEECYWALFYMALHTFLHNLLNVLVQIANRMGLQKNIPCTVYMLCM
jgi:hypothetical protein